MHEERFSQLRALLLETPSAAIWSEIIKIFDDWEVQDGIEMAIDYANEHLQSWPAHLREAPETWCEVLFGQPKALIKRKWRRGERAHPGLALCRLVLAPRTRAFRNVKPQIIKHLHSATSLQQLEILAIEGLALGDDGALFLSQCKHLTALKTLYFSYNDISPQGVWDMAESRLFVGLAGLYLDNNKLGDEGIRGLAQCEHLQSLQKLGLQNVELSTRSVRMLAQSPHLAHLQSLDISYNGWDFGSEGIIALADAAFLPDLQQLNVSALQVTESMLDTLLTLPFQSLRALDLAYNPITLEDADKLIRCDALQQLTSLHCDGLPQDSLLRLQEHFGTIITTQKERYPWM